MNMLLSQSTRTIQKTSLVALPSIIQRRKSWRDAYAEKGARANLRTALLDISAKQYWRLEKFRVSTGVSLVENSLIKFERASHFLNGRIPRRILNLGSGIGLFEARPGFLAVKAAKRGYSYACCDFANGATMRCKKRVMTALQRCNVLRSDITFHTQSILSFLNTQKDNSVSVVELYQVLQHSNPSEIERIAEQLKRVLFRTGIICIEYPPADNNNKADFNMERTRLHELSFIKQCFYPYECLDSAIIPLSEFEQSYFGQFGIRQYHGQR